MNDTLTQRLRTRAREARGLARELITSLTSLEDSAGREASWDHVAKADHVRRQLEILVNHLKSKPGEKKK